MPSSVLPLYHRRRAAAPWPAEQPPRLSLSPAIGTRPLVNRRHTDETVPERRGYASSAESRTVGVIGTGLVYALVLSGFALTVSTVTPVRKAPPALTVVELRSHATPETAPAEPIEVPPGPDQQERQREQPAALDNSQAVPIQPPSVVLQAPAEPMAESAGPPVDRIAPRADDARLVEQTTAPPSPSGGTQAKAKWNDLLLSHLEMFRRYPRQAERARQQGVVLVDITLDRAGNVLEATIRQGSGFPLLDAEALATVRRASPLPAPTDDVPGDPVTAAIPIQFSLRR